MGNVKQLTDGEILNKLCENLNLSIHGLYKALGYKSPATLYHVINGVNSLSESMINKIIRVYPNVNALFLRSGEGEVILSKEEIQNQANFFQNYLNPPSSKNTFMEFAEIPEKLDALIDAQEKTNELLALILEKI